MVIILKLNVFFYDDHDHDDDYCSTTVPDNIRMKILGLYGGIKKWIFST